MRVRLKADSACVPNHVHDLISEPHDLPAPTGGRSWHHIPASYMGSPDMSVHRSPPVRGMASQRAESVNRTQGTCTSHPFVCSIPACSQQSAAGSWGPKTALQLRVDRKGPTAVPEATTGTPGVASQTKQNNTACCSHRNRPKINRPEIKSSVDRCMWLILIAQVPPRNASNYAGVAVRVWGRDLRYLSVCFPPGQRVSSSAKAD